MSDGYIHPRFNIIVPNNIIKSIKKIEELEAYKEDIEFNKNPPEDSFKKCYKKLLENKKLTTKEFKVLSFYINEIIRDNNFEKYYFSISNKINDFKTYRGFIRPFLSYIYNFYDENIDKDKINKIYKLLKICLEKLKFKQKYEVIYNYNKEFSYALDYLNKTSIKINEFNNIIDIEEIANKLFIKSTDKYYLELMIGYIIKNHKHTNYFENLKKIVLLMNLKQKKQVFRGIINCYLNDKNIENYPKKWFVLIGEELGDPYKRNNYKWDNLDEEYKETYRRWRNGNELYEFFSKIAAETDGKRFNFWKEYIDCIYRIKYYREIQDALIMEFKNHVFVEFAQNGNALYVYKKEHYNIDYIEDTINKTGGNIKINDLKRFDLKELKLNHSGNWQYRFQSELLSRGYKIDG